MADDSEQNKLSQLDDRHSDTADAEEESTNEKESEGGTPAAASAQSASADSGPSPDTPSPEDSNVEWKPLTLYLTDSVHTEFNKPFFMRLQLEYPELQDYMKRELQQAAIEVAMEYREEVAERAQEIHERTGGVDEEE